MSFAIVLLNACRTTERYGRLAITDVRIVATAPLHATAREWTRTAIAAAAVASTTLIDDEVRDRAQSNHSHALDEFTRLVEPLGGGNSTKVIAAIALYGIVRDDAHAKATAFDAAVSSLIASRAITPALKAMIGRTRPNGGDRSFPSNHATEAFALATAVSEHYPAARYVAYGLAGGVGLARVYHDAHWASDVVAGAIIGTAVARSVTHTNRIRWNVVPTRRGAILTVSADASGLFRARSSVSRRPSQTSWAP